MKNKAIYLIFSFLLFSNLAFANEITLCGKRQQGSILIGKTSPNIRHIFFNKTSIPISENHQFMIAFERDDKLEHELTIVDSKNNKETKKLTITKTKWDIQNLTGIEQKKVTPSKDDQAEIDAERSAIRFAQKEETKQLFWQTEFIIPTIGRTSGNFGGQRIMNGKKMNPHMGMDIAAPIGTKIKAPADGIISLASMDNYFYSGNVVIINHGYSLFTIYAHMNKIYIKTEGMVKKGDIIGEVGKTGRVTGAHLHWGASLKGTRFDPKTLLGLQNDCEKL